MKIVGTCICHYGLEYLEASIRSVIDVCDVFYVLYADKPSFGRTTYVPRPPDENRDSLHEAACQGAGGKLRWVESEWDNEGVQRDTMFKLEPGMDVLLTVDADEIWPTGMAAEMIEQTSHEKEAYWRIPNNHYWRSFYKCVTNHPTGPVRIKWVKRHRDPGEPPRMVTTKRKINHMGYAQSAAVVHYKMLIHGHAHEWDPTWYENKFLPNAQIEVHPCIRPIWNPVDVDPWADGMMPEWMRDHEYAELEVIP